MQILSFTILLVVFSLGLAQYETEVGEETPYTVVKTIPVKTVSGDWSIEERNYPAAKWVCHETDRPNSRSQRKSFFALFKYIVGTNADEAEIPMTAPVTMQKDGGSVYRMCFYLPAAHQAAPPAPIDTEVFIQDRPSMTVLTRTFGGFATKDSHWETEAKELQEALQKAGEDKGIDFSAYYRAGYDAPTKFVGRRNEIWYVKN
ncbi:unnamed protein product [Meganyctiphanes norvegica]|uniref:Uncharacterized protein n=1 Tax=Meganyctiphanes norvegica TaxID=48144 RepID=A0AAV2RNE0_MEGNR